MLGDVAKGCGHDGVCRPGKSAPVGLYLQMRHYPDIHRGSPPGRSHIAVLGDRDLGPMDNDRADDMTLTIVPAQDLDHGAMARQACRAMQIPGAGVGVDTPFPRDKTDMSDAGPRPREAAHDPQYALESHKVRLPY